MSTISVDVSSTRIPVLQVGYQGENEVTDVYFDVSSWITDYGEGTAQLKVKRPQNSEEESYTLSLPISGGIATWTVTDTDTANKGNGKVQLLYTVSGALKKSVIYPYKVGKSLVSADNPVDPFDTWIERAKAWATGKLLDDEDVPSTDETYHNNSKNWTERAKAWAIGKLLNESDVESTDEAYHNNAKYWAEIGEAHSEDSEAWAKGTRDGVSVEEDDETYEKNAKYYADEASVSAGNAAESETNTQAMVSPLNSRMGAIETEQAAQDARMDTFTTLTEGSTTGDAELQDIRVGADGATYPNAGDAVRGQVSDLRSDSSEIFDSICSANVTLEQGAVMTTNWMTYEELKTASTTRVRCVEIIETDPNKTYIIYAKRATPHLSTLQYSIVWYNQAGISVGATDGWKSGKYSLSGHHYFSIALRNSDNDTIAPSDIAEVIVIEKDAIENINKELKALEKSADDLGDIATVGQKKPSIISGVYTWASDLSEMVWTENAKRATADLRSLDLGQGDSVGITDYTTYSIAFGDNKTGWYDGGYKTSDVVANSSSILPYVLLVKRNDNADMTASDFVALESQFHSTTAVKSVGFTQIAVSDMRSKLGVSSSGYVHLSFDDVGYCVLNLANNGASFNSLWDEPFFGMLKRLHDTYGAIFSLYIWDVANLANIPSKFKTELMDSSAWLKFGFHSYTEGSLADTSYNDAKTQYETFINYVFSKIGGVNSVDRMPRLNYFAGNVNALRALRDANCGCIGFLNTDDTRSAYYLTQEELTYLRTHSLWSDRTNGLQFVSTVMRLDWFVSGFSSQYDYNVPVENNPYDELVYRYGQPAMADLYGGLIVSTHEWQTYSSSYVLNSAMVDRIEQVCQFANDYGYDFDYPQNRIPNITSYIFA